ncbi:MAG: hypothetical protein JSV77_06790 [Dehalococcoidales bacterium]|nr:MAG: hypothetical protein JSV77_06790 [Dehalococcoidales bacterium]
MKIWAITVSVLLAGAVGAGTFFYIDLSGDVDTANAEIATLEGDKAALEADVTELETDLADTEATLADTETELADTEADLATAEADLTAAQSQISTLQSSYAAAQSRANSLQTQLNTAESQYESLQQQVDACNPYGEILEKYYFVPGGYFTMYEILDVTLLVEATGDAELMELWDTYLEYDTPENAYNFWVAVWDGLWETLCGAGTSV